MQRNHPKAAKLPQPLQTIPSFSQPDQFAGEIIAASREITNKINRVTIETVSGAYGRARVEGNGKSDDAHGYYAAVLPPRDAKARVRWLGVLRW